LLSLKPDLDVIGTELDQLDLLYIGDRRQSSPMFGHTKRVGQSYPVAPAPEDPG